jgi:hypothetical protein
VEETGTHCSIGQPVGDHEATGPSICRVGVEGHCSRAGHRAHPTDLVNERDGRPASVRRVANSSAG